MTSIPRRDKRIELIRFGVEVFTEKGFHNTSIDEIVAAVGVPKGSFAYYFGSKDAYTVAVIEAYGEYFSKKLDNILTNKSVNPIRRIELFTDEAINGVERFDFKRGCLVGNLGQELGSIDDKFRAVLLATLRQWQEKIRICLDEAKEIGELNQGADTAELSSFFWYAWEGAVLGAKLERSRVPLEIVKRAFFKQLTCTS